MSAYLHRGPMRAFFPAALPLLAHTRVSYGRKWAPARILHKGFQAAVGQLELISDIRAFTPRANVSIFPGSTPSAGPRESLIGQPVVCWMGQCEVVAWILWCKEWAHARILRKGWANSSSSAISLHLHRGPRELIKLISPCRTRLSHGPTSFTSQLCAGWTNASSLPPEYYCTGSGPMRGFCISDFRLMWANSSSSVISAHLYREPTQPFSLVALPLQAHARVSCGSPLHSGWGQCELIARIFWSRKWAHARIFRSGFQAAVGQFELISDIRSFTPRANPSIFPAAGPRESVIRQPVACWMGQFEAIARIL